METLNALLTIHVLIAVSGVIASYAVAIWLFKRTLPIRALKIASLVAFLAYITAWITGGYYYVVYYGSNVKPLIKEGDYPWAHLVMMEAKEHIFLFLPVLSFVILLVIWLYGNALNENRQLKNALALVALITLLIGVFMALAGITISGAAR